MDWLFKTDVGRVRDHNEDNGGVYVNSHSDSVLGVVADGMGGHKSGDVASAIACKVLEDEWLAASSSFTEREAVTWLSSTITRVNEEIFKKSKEDMSCYGMGTTVVAAICTEEYVAVGHVGDSRAYLITDDSIHLKTDDHSLVNELVKNGQISEEEAENHPRKNVLLRALGTEAGITVEVSSFSWRQGELVFLCSDGLSNKVSDADLLRMMTKEGSLSDKGERLVHMANERGGEDNITIAAITHPSSPRGS
ncbi:Stp1/IreP family PP2C-type Ser/Thr phosphatase [Thalassorhabdus alkalitolerans]|uniref:Stp1/IreP family PP2C-type Ser/Thr phosphatase n=1 Tax=Thalassorhabdus alkalitolerans TaxID=2282697 RepID=A0ABW0YL52_9BACI|nr:Stp1/IreP family PP2C-type Ser/Thr phosphatase [Thalassobacillus sp. C254]